MNISNHQTKYDDNRKVFGAFLDSSNSLRH